MDLLVHFLFTYEFELAGEFEFVFVSASILQMVEQNLCQRGNNFEPVAHILIRIKDWCPSFQKMSL